MISLAEVLDLIHSSRKQLRTVRATGSADDDVWRLWWAGDGQYRYVGGDGAGAGRRLTDGIREPG